MCKSNLLSTSLVVLFCSHWALAADIPHCLPNHISDSGPTNEIRKIFQGSFGHMDIEGFHTKILSTVALNYQARIQQMQEEDKQAVTLDSKIFAGSTDPDVFSSWRNLSRQRQHFSEHFAAELKDGIGQLLRTELLSDHIFTKIAQAAYRESTFNAQVTFTSYKVIPRFILSNAIEDELDHQLVVNARGALICTRDKQIRSLCSSVDFTTQKLETFLMIGDPSLPVIARINDDLNKFSHYTLTDYCIQEQDTQ